MNENIVTCSVVQLDLIYYSWTMMAARTTKVPLEAQQTERVNPQTDLVECLPTLHRAWITEVNFLPYCPPNYLHETSADSAHVPPHQLDPVWVEGLEMMDSDLHWLLQQPHASFWCQVMFDSSLQKFLDSYLRYATRSFDSPTLLPAKVQETLRNIHRRVFMIFLRMSVNKESPEEFISVEVYSTIIYEHYLFDVPKLIDLCVLYGATNKPLLSKMVVNVFEKQPQYHQDWQNTAEGIGQILDKILSEVTVTEDKALRLDRTKTLSPSKFSDLVLYIADIADSLCAFVDVYPPSSNELLTAGFAERLVTFYETIVPELQSQWHLLKKKVDNQHHIKHRFRQLKHSLARLIHSVLQSCYHSSHSCLLLPADGKSAGEEQGSANRGRVVDGFISLVTAVLAEKAFLKEFEKHFSLMDCVNNMQSAHPELPATHFDYILSALSSMPISDPLMTGTTPQDVPDPSLSLITHIKELLPHHDEKFIQACLKEYNNDSERVVNHVLEMNLPSHLMEMLEWETGNGTKDGAEQSRNETSESLLEQRSNVYDNDEFDVFRRKEVDLNRIHIGKKYDPGSASMVLDDKAVVDSSRERYKKYEIETQWSYVSEEDAHQLQVGGAEGVANGMLDMPGMSPGMQFDMYNDDYDDTYDSQNVGAADNDSADELLSVQRLNPKGLYSRHHHHHRYAGDDGGSDKEENSETPSGPISSWPPDKRPPPTSMKRENRGQGNTAATVRGTKPGSEARGQSTKSKGHHQGDTGVTKQDTSSLKSRQAKERHKGSRANHNRKAGAEWKRNKGMGAPARF